MGFVWYSSYVRFHVVSSVSGAAPRPRCMDRHIEQLEEITKYCRLATLIREPKVKWADNFFR